MGQDVQSPPSITIIDHELEVVHDFVYPSSIISDTRILESELNKHIGKAATAILHCFQGDKESVVQQQTDRAYKDPRPTEHVLSTLLYGCDSWTLRTWQEQKLDAFKMSCLPCVLTLEGQNPQTIHCSGESRDSELVYTVKAQMLVLAWTCTVIKVDDGRIPKDL